MEKKRSVKSDLERRRPTFLKIGLIASLAFALMAFEYTTWTATAYHLGDIDPIVIETILPPVTKIKKEKPKQEKPKAKDKFKVVEKVVEPVVVEPEPVKEDPLSIVPLDSIIEFEPIEPVEPTGPFVKAEKMPHFNSCASISNETKRAQCTEIGFIEHLNDHLRVPRDMMFSEKAFVYFVINEKGNVTDLKLLNEVSPSLEKEIERVFELMPKLIPGEQRSKKVSVQYTIPVNVQIR